MVSSVDTDIVRTLLKLNRDAAVPVFGKYSFLQSGENKNELTVSRLSIKAVWVVIYHIIDDEIVYWYSIRPHASPCVPIHNGIVCRHEIQKPHFFLDTVDLPDGSIRRFLINHPCF